MASGPRSRAHVAVAALAFLLGCGREDLSDAGFVTSLRLLGAQAEPPEADPGESVVVTAWAVDPRGGRIDVTWSACMLPSNGLANPGCVGGGAGLVALGSGSTLTITVPAVTRAMLGPPDGTGGVYLPLVMHVTANGDSVDGVYRLRIHGDQPPNNNPMFDSITDLPTDGTVNMVRVNEVLAMVANYVDGSREGYFIPGAPKQVFEMLTTQWFATAGTFPNAPVGGTGVQSLTIDRALPPPGGHIDVWVVGHDDRGGSTMVHGILALE
jgi:hypothetical protein